MGERVKCKFSADAAAADEGGTLEVGHHDLCVVGTGEQVMCARGEADRAHITGVWTVHLDYSSSSDVVEHTRAVFLSCC